MWKAERAILRLPYPYEHLGLSREQAIKRTVDLTCAAERLGSGAHLFAHMKQIAPCLVAASRSEYVAAHHDDLIKL